jgi:hypothetical protein
MSGPPGIMAVILLEAAVGGAVVLWASGVWGAARRGFLLLTGVTLALCALGSFLLARRELAGAPIGVAGRVVVTLGALTALLFLWQVLLVARAERLAAAVGLAAAVAGPVALTQFAQLRPDASYALLELLLGSLFLGSALFGLLLGHWYLVERRLSNVYMIRSAWWFAAGVAGAVGAALLSARNPAPPVGGGFSPLLGVPGFSVMLAIGLVAVCALIAGFVWKLANEGGRSIQAATGYFYLAVIMAFSAELSSKFRFFEAL